MLRTKGALDDTTAAAAAFREEAIAREVSSSHERAASLVLSVVSRSIE